MLAFKPYRGKRAFEDIADQIRNAILSKYLTEGDRLPSERELAEQFQVGRVSIREALRKLETMGFIEVRKGSSGGAFIRVGDMDTLASMIMDRLQLEGTTHDMMIEARIGLERAVIVSAIEFATPKDLDRLERDIDESREVLPPLYAGNAVAKMIHFHILLAEASHNVPYIMFTHSMMEWASRKLKGWVPSEQEQMYSCTSHQEIFQAVSSRDKMLAKRLIREHISKMGELVSRREEQRAPVIPTKGQA